MKAGKENKSPKMNSLFAPSSKTKSLQGRKQMWCRDKERRGTRKNQRREQKGWVEKQNEVKVIQKMMGQEDLS